MCVLCVHTRAHPCTLVQCTWVVLQCLQVPFQLLKHEHSSSEGEGFFSVALFSVLQSWSRWWSCSVTQIILTRCCSPNWSAGSTWTNITREPTRTHLPMKSSSSSLTATLMLSSWSSSGIWFLIIAWQCYLLSFSAWLGWKKKKVVGEAEIKKVHKSH